MPALIISTNGVSANRQSGIPVVSARRSASTAGTVIRMWQEGLIGLTSPALAGTAFPVRVKPAAEVTAGGTSPSLSVIRIRAPT
jgi:hypothetical protein